MKQLIGNIGDRLQAIFPPNRIAILLAGPITAASLWLSGWATAHIPGTNLPAGVIAGAMYLGATIVVALLYKWFDQWQQGEPIHVGAEIEELIDELETKFFSSLGTHEAVQNALADLHGKISRGEVNEAQVANSIEALHGVVADYLREHHGAPSPVVDAAEGVVPAGAAEGVVPQAPAPEAPAQ